MSARHTDVMYSMYTCTAHMQLRSHYHTCQNLTFYVPRTTKFRLALKDRSYGSVGDSLLSSNRHRRVLPYKWSAVTRAAPIRRPPTDQRSLCRLQRELHCRQENITVHLPRRGSSGVVQHRPVVCHLRRHPPVLVCTFPKVGVHRTTAPPPKALHDFNIIGCVVQRTGTADSE